MSEIEKVILVVDDSNTNVVLLEAVLSAEGYTILTALGAREAFSIIKKERPSIILLDLHMPIISGFDFLKHIKSEEETSNIPIVVVSALTDDESIRKALNLGAVDFIKKPVDIPLLMKTVATVLQKSNKPDHSSDE
jgi:CheY-like chemotaxis protein